MEKKYYPSVMLCGYERGGTTLLSEIFRANGYESGFECGVLMCEKPAEFNSFMPYSKMIKAGWKLNTSIEHFIPESNTFIDFYHNIITASGLSKQANKFFDKTPIYMKELGKCLHKAPFVEKAIIITRDPRAVFTSWAKRNKDSEKMSIEKVVKKNLKVYSNRYNRYFAGAIAERDNPKVMFVSYEHLCIHPHDVYQSMGCFVEGKKFLPLVKPSRFNNVYNNTIQKSRVNDYEPLLSSKVQDKILKECALSALFFASNNEKNKHLNYFTSLDEKIREVLNKYNLRALTTEVDSKYFNPWLYLYLNKRVLKAGCNPLQHFKEIGISKGLPF